MTPCEGEAARSARYAIYWAPPAGSSLASIGERWLGREAATHRALVRQAIGEFDDRELAAITEEPRRYGLHATLKPPFRLADAFTPSMLAEDIASFAESQAPFVTPSLSVTQIAHFVALTPTIRSTAVDALAASCVEFFDRFRAPLEAEELARRRATKLTVQQEENLRRWGYPYVMGEFRFHITLTGPISGAVTKRLTPLLESLFTPATAEPLEIGEIALFLQPTKGASFQLKRRFKFGRVE